MSNPAQRFVLVTHPPAIYLGLLLLIIPPSSKSQELDTYAIDYRAKAGIVTATARRSLSKIERNSYQLLNTLNVALAGQSVAEIIERSEVVLLDDQTLVPNSYSKEQFGFRDNLESITYNWDQSAATIINSDQFTQINLEKGTFDQLSHQIAMRENFTRGGEQFSYNVIDDFKLKEYRYSVIGREEIKTPLGDFHSIKIERTQPRDDKRSIVFWLSTEWAGVLLRMDQVINGTIELTLEIQDGFVNGRPITGQIED